MVTGPSGAGGRIVPLFRFGGVGATRASLIVPRARVERLFTRDRWLDGCEALYAAARADAAIPAAA